MRPSLQTSGAAVAEDNGLGELTLDKKKKKKKKAAFVESVSLVSRHPASPWCHEGSSLVFVTSVTPDPSYVLCSCMQDAPAAGDNEEAAAEEDPEAGAGLDLSLTKKKKKRKPKARTDEEFGAMVEDAEGVAVDGAPSVILHPGRRCGALQPMRVLT